MRAFHIMSDQELFFDENTTPLWAVCYGYCEENNLMSALFASAQDLRFEQFANNLPIVYGKKTIACGNWAAMLEGANHA